MAIVPTRVVIDIGRDANNRRIIHESGVVAFIPSVGHARLEYYPGGLDDSKLSDLRMVSVDRKPTIEEAATFAALMEQAELAISFLR